MQIREWLNQNPAAATGIGVGVIVLALAAIAVQFWRSGPPRVEVQDRAYYSADDGASFFVAKVQQQPLTAEDGRTAFRAYVFECQQCPAQPKFVNHLERHLGEAPAVASAPAEDATPQAPQYGAPGGAAAEILRAYSAIQVKKPGQRQWVPITDARAAPIMAGTCPTDRSHEVRHILP